ncbi:hypothetical protein FOZ61_003247 [Perkinsus olseni]|uniref:RPAP1 C-terminal domain-containing protein n=1 Tax=Perkinsus olseni TaxID=32597 RepID=A0A7J6MIE5_PEROL|nr:hypothetical protein FOZ61_003247 [Perkinsus olseni]
MPRKPAWLSEEDLLKEQAEFINGDKPAATVVRVGGQENKKAVAFAEGTKEDDAPAKAHEAEQQAELSSVDVPLSRVMNDRVVERHPDLTAPVAPPQADPASTSKGFPKPKLRAWRSKKLAASRVPLAQRKETRPSPAPQPKATVDGDTSAAVLGMTREEREETMAEVQRLFSASNIEFLKERGRKKLESDISGQGQEAAAGVESDDVYEGEVDLGFGNRLELDELEIDKQKWMEPVGVEEDLARPEDESFEGRRFDFEGNELKRGSAGVEGRYDPILYHHGEEPGRPGYTVQELLVLSDSNNGGQRQLALRMLREESACSGELDSLMLALGIYSTLGNIIANDSDVSQLWIRHRQVHVRFAVSVSHANINVRHAALAALVQLLVRFPRFTNDLADIPEFLISLENIAKQEMFRVDEQKESPSVVSLAHILSLLLPLAPKLQDICSDIINFAADSYRVATCTLLLPNVDDYYRASQIGSMRVLGGLERPKQSDLDWCCAGLDRWSKGVTDGTMDAEEIRSYLPVFSRYMCLRAGDDEVVLHALKVVEALWRSDKAIVYTVSPRFSRESFKRSLEDCLDSAVQKVEDKAANDDAVTAASVELLELLTTTFEDHAPVCRLAKEPSVSHWLLAKGDLNNIGRALFLLDLDEPAVDELSVLVSHSEGVSSEVWATLCRYRSDKEAAARGLRAVGEDTFPDALGTLWHGVGVEGPWDNSTPMSVLQKASIETVTELERVNREVTQPLLQWGDMAMAVLERVGDFTESSEAWQVGMNLLTYPSGCAMADGGMMKWHESARVDLRKRIENGIPTPLESSLMLALCGRSFPLSSRVDVWCDTDFMIVLAKTEGIQALTGESELSSIEQADLSDRESQSLLRVWRDQCQSFLREAADLALDDANLVVRVAGDIVRQLDGV